MESNRLTFLLLIKRCICILHWLLLNV